MARLHLRIPESQIPEGLTALVNDMNGEKPWTLPRHRRVEIVTEFYEKALDLLGVSPVPEVFFERGGYGTGVYTYCPGTESALGLSLDGCKVTFRRWRTVSVIEALAEHLNARRGAGPDPIEFACSVLYRANPVSFRASARRGLIPGVTIQDTYSSESWQKLVEGGLVNTYGTYNFDADAAATFLSTGTMPWDGDDDEDEPEDVTDSYDDSLDEDDLDDYEPEVDAPVMETEDDTPDPTVVMPSEVSDGLDGLGITDLRKISRGSVSGGYSMRKPALIHAIRQAMSAEQIASAIAAGGEVVVR